jgi:hypothetical protein
MAQDIVLYHCIFAVYLVLKIFASEFFTRAGIFATLAAVTGLNLGGTGVVTSP